MTKKQITAYWLALISMALTAALLLSVGISYARYDNLVLWNTVLPATAPEQEEWTPCLNDVNILDLGQLHQGVNQVLFTLEDPDLTPDQLQCVFSEEVEELTAELTEESGTLILSVTWEGQVTDFKQLSVEISTAEQPLGSLRFVLPTAMQEVQTEQLSTMVTTAQDRLVTEDDLVIAVKASSEADRIMLNMAENGFPAGTCYTLDGDIWYQLVADGAIWLPYQDQTELRIRCDKAARIPTGEVVVTTQLLLGNESLKETTLMTIFEEVKLISDELLSSSEDALTLALPQSLAQTALDYKLEAVTMNADGSRVYTDVTDGFRTDHSEERNTFTIQPVQTITAGTYRLTLTWQMEGNTVKQTQITFFINYADTSSSGGTQ